MQIRATVAAVVLGGIAALTACSQGPVDTGGPPTDIQQEQDAQQRFLDHVQRQIEQRNATDNRYVAPGGGSSDCYQNAGGGTECH